MSKTNYTVSLEIQREYELIEILGDTYTLIKETKTQIKKGDHRPEDQK